MTALQHLGTAVEAYAEKHGAYPRTLPRAVDGWNHPILYNVAGKHYVLRSTGRDGKNDGRFDGVTTSFDDDIVFSDGIFHRFREGL